MVLVIGSSGNMGKRYCAILKMLRVDYTGFDIKDSIAPLPELAKVAERVILATPTDAHVSGLNALISITQCPILCEKPITKNIQDLSLLRQMAGSRVFCVNQYAHLPEYDKFRGAEGRTYYNYFKHGDDGLAWDCFQLFNLAGGSLALNESSPIWKCRINGVEIDQAGMDWAYVRMIQDFLGPMKRVWDLFTAEVTTKKVMRWIAEEQIQG